MKNLHLSVENILKDQINYLFYYFLFLHLCSLNIFLFQWDEQICAPLDALLSELRQICKNNPGNINQLHLHIEGNFSIVL